MLLALAGCNAANPPPLAATTIVIPDELKTCPAAIPEPPAPKPPRTVEIIADAYNRAKLIGQQNEAALKECYARLRRLRDLIEASSTQ